MTSRRHFPDHARKARKALCAVTTSERRDKMVWQTTRLLPGSGS